MNRTLQFQRSLYWSKKTYLLLLFLMGILNAFGQNDKHISGVIKDEGGAALPGVNVLIKGTSLGTTSDNDGKYSLSIPDEDVTLIFSFIGYTSKEVAAANQSVINVTLTPDVQSLQEVVVVGYGTQRKSDLTGSIASIKSEEIRNIGGSNVAEALQGKAPGVDIRNIGSPGADPVVFIRGLGTNGDASPLYVVDGMMVSSIGFLASGDIASIEVLKDASATSIYGSRGSNGVVLITTKKGQSGKPVVSFSARSGFQFLTNKYKTANGKEYAQLVNLFMANKGSAAMYNTDTVGTGTNWLNKVTQPGYINDYQLSIAGGSDNVKYNISANYFKQDGVLKYTGFDRLTLRANNEYKLTKKLTLGNNITFSSRHYTGDSQWNGGRGLNSVYRISPLLSVKQPNGLFTPGQDVDIVNPYAALYYNKDINDNPIEFVGNGWLNYELIKGLSFRSSYGIDYTHDYRSSFSPKYNLGANQSNGSNTVGTMYSDSFTWLWENTLNYDKTIGAHSFNLLAGYTAQNKNTKSLDLLGANLLSTDDNYRYIQSLPITSVSYNSTAKPTSESILSYLFRANYSFKERYLFTGTFRADGSSKFARGNRWGYFPSVALGWRVSNEEFMKNIKWIDNLKVRGSWGQIGSNKISNYLTYSTLATDSWYDAVFNRTFYTNATTTVANNPNITWEVSQQSDLGLEFATHNNQLKIELDYYNRSTKNLLVTVPVPGGSTGVGATVSNNGTVNNKGFEFLVSWDDKVGSDFSYGVRFTGSINRNKVTQLGVDSKGFGDWMLPSDHMFARNYPIGEFYGYKVQGIAQTQAQIDDLNAKAVEKSGVANKQYWSNLKPGDLIFKDVNGDGYVDVKDKTDIGNPNPKFVGGITLTASYKRFDIAIDIMGSFGAKIYNVTRNQFINSGLSNLNKEWLNSWTPTNTKTSIPRYASGTSVSEVSDFNIASASFIKPRYVELGYTFNKDMLSKIKISNLRLYVNGSNLFYITKYKGFSPEVSNSYGVTTMGDDFRTYPVTGMVKFGLDAKF
ncbi:MAG TPA: TonB-dependent receptor [Cyclobacteriaceae bacterium]|nr:TonB-dependent receptor [Cyclobacteriaceae bacterium]